ncbi:MAG TPA: DUF433 domain-containing protein, partial [Caldilineaceae bacterium]|nr:DUF433 domain-containing protein [Caldilineaceae bacterium]
AQPTVAGAPVPVYAVLELLEAGFGFDTIIHDYYPTLTIDDIQACIRYAVNLIRAEEVHIALAH